MSEFLRTRPHLGDVHHGSHEFRIALFDYTMCSILSNQEGDVVFVKESGGRVQAVAEIGNVWFHRLDGK